MYERYLYHIHTRKKLSTFNLFDEMEKKNPVKSHKFYTSYTLNNQNRQVIYFGIAKKKKIIIILIKIKSKVCHKKEFLES